MKKILLFLCFINISIANELLKFCEENESGEIYSAMVDADSIETNFEMIGLNPYNSPYKELIEQNQDLSIWDIAEKHFKTYPEIQIAIDKWEYEECMDRGAEMFERAKKRLK